MRKNKCKAHIADIHLNGNLKLGIVIPCYNEAEVLPETTARITVLLDNLVRQKKISSDSRIWYIDDGSTDTTWDIIEELAAQNKYISAIKLSRNRGHQNALLAGLFNAEGDVLVSIDADLQDDVGIIEQMLNDYAFGNEIVYAVRNKRDTDTIFKRITAETFYKFMNIMGAESIRNHSDYRLMSRRAIECLKDFQEVNLFLRGLVPLIGFKSSIVYYERLKRFAGKSKYPLKKMLGLALDGITSFSVVPLRIITLIGFFIFFLTMLITLWVLWVRLFTGNAIPGWASTVLPMYLISGVQILCIGIIGEYLGKIYSEVKKRPRYIIDKVI